MKQIKLNRGEFLLVEVPEDIKTYGLGIAAMYKGKPYLCYDTPNSFDDERIYLPSGEYEIIGMASEVGEGVWARVLGFDYPDEIDPEDILPSESGHSWIKSHGMKPETTFILKLK